MFDVKRFKAHLALNGYTICDLAKDVGLNPTTLYRKIKREGDFTREEIQKLKKILHLTAAEVEEIFFKNQLTYTQE